MFRLDGRVALVTGASRGIGEAIARRFVERGAKVVLAARDEERLNRLAAELGPAAMALRLDVAASAEIPARLASIPEEFAAVDILVHNAGITRDNLLLRMSLEHWDEVLRTNLTPAFALSKELARGMVRRRWGRILSISSVIGLMGNAGQANYAAAKAGLTGLAKSLAKELGGRGITVNVIAPGYIETAMTEGLPEETRRSLRESIALKRLGRVEDVAAAAVYLASEEAGYVTGHVLNVSGGLYI